MKNFVILLFIILTLTGCASKEEYHNYVICHIDADRTVVYDEYDNLYELSGNTLRSVSSNTYIAKPAIHFFITEKEFELLPDLPGKYNCTLSDAFAYVTQLSKQGFKMRSIKETPYRCDITMDNNSTFIKLYIEHGSMRVYARDKDNNPIDLGVLSNE